MSSTREAILAEIYRKIAVIPGITTVTRKPIESPKELNEIAHTQFPVINIIGGLPKPDAGNPIELGAESSDSAILSSMDVFIRVFGYDRTSPDTAISTLFNTIYQNLYYAPTLKTYTYTNKAVRVDVSMDDIIFCTETAAATVQFKHMKSLTTLGFTADLSTLPYTNPAFFTNVTSSLASLAKTIEVNPSAIVEYRDPYFLFTIIATIKYVHYTYEI